MAFATYAHLVLQYAPSRIGELASSTRTPVPETDFDTDPVIAWVLERATEEILMSCRQGKRYSEEDLQTLADSATAGWSIRGLTCDLAYASLQMRKGVRMSDMDQLCPGYKNATITLQLLASGNEVFPRIDGDNHPDAGTPRTADLRRQTTTPLPQCSWSQTASAALLPNSPTTLPSNSGCC